MQAIYFHFYINASFLILSFRPSDQEESHMSEVKTETDEQIRDQNNKVAGESVRQIV